jgi:hypothetical protein
MRAGGREHGTCGEGRRKLRRTCGARAGVGTQDVGGLRESTERIGASIAALAGRGVQRVGGRHSTKGNRGRSHVKRRQGDVGRCY